MMPVIMLPAFDNEDAFIACKWVGNQDDLSRWIDELESILAGNYDNRESSIIVDEGIKLNNEFWDIRVLNRDIDVNPGHDEGVPDEPFFLNENDDHPFIEFYEKYFPADVRILHGNLQITITAEDENDSFDVTFQYEMPVDNFVELCSSLYTERAMQMK